ncbi:MAG: NADH-quinone oxidoreductase subunit D [Actinomycetia bacterium]|nr:NADH-quinone oxidoreductase subunit D [Actinomycetes bacterium]
MVLKKQEMILNMGPQHPSTHGVFRAVLTLDGENIIELKPHIGYLHRGVEKIAENRTYLQFIPYTDRLDYVSAMFNNWVYVKAVEELAGIEVPERAEYIRVIVAELNRIASHLVFLTTAGLDTGALTPFFYFFSDRDRILDLFEEISGARLTYNYLRFGGVKNDINKKFIEGTKDLIKYLRSKIDEYENLLLRNYIFLERTKGIGILSTDLALEYGVSGPVLRASNFNWDLRKDEPYSVYEKFDFNITIGKNGDCWDRYWVRLEEIRQSLNITEQAIDSLPAGDFKTKGVPLMLKPPKGEIYTHIESPRGEQGVYINSDGSEKPYRLKWRSPAYANLSILPEMAKGSQIPDLVVIIGSLDPVFGEVDR